jgi:hypothetical protein
VWPRHSLSQARPKAPSGVQSGSIVKAD